MCMPVIHRPLLLWLSSRLLQVLVLPNLQCRGYGRALVAAAYALARERDAVDLTVRACTAVFMGL
jgi:GNAT superfamily N-acetyltransferase